ncbi:sugar transferase [uncultured Modestobacter sp.]|uniref:sugar transferase n=1 Tax=uncultured Modestobacter sp. TaxID=380048 RepID=UPI002604E49C|nr:sugar transferase [uncultured Modestobacter sp.]
MSSTDVVVESPRSGRTSAAQGWARFAPAIRGEGTTARRAWQSRYVARTVAFDALCAVTAALMAHGLWFGWTGSPPFWEVVLLPLIWLPAMLVSRTYEKRFLWVGVEEYRRVFDAAVALLAAVGFVSWALDMRVARGFVVLALPVATALTLLARLAHRHWLHRQRRGGRYQQTTLLVGHSRAVADLDEQLQRATDRGYRVIGCCLPSDQHSTAVDAFHGLPVLGGVDEVAEVVTRFEVDTVAVLPSQELDGRTLRNLGWQLEDTDAEMLVAPAITDVVGPRVHIRPVAGLPLLHMERPELTGLRRFTKATFDRTSAFLGLAFLCPVLLGIAIAVRASSAGPVFFRQERIGHHGEPFMMLKFRSMVPGAHAMVADLTADSDGNGVLFKKRDDPRVTRVGKVLRRYSLDELPQLINVLRGEMSLVGPRPPLATEVAAYGLDMRRRFLVKPGLTGLWQVSGRSDLSWDDSVRIDVRYVENWSLAFDFMILAKTARAVLRGSGAY